MTVWTGEDRDLFDVLDRHARAHGRSQQVRVGPSGVGDPCPRSLTYALAGVREEWRPYERWKATVGTACHAWAEAAVARENDRLGYRRYLTETRVDVGLLGGEPLTGSSDLFDVFGGVVTDWKFVGPGMARKYRANGLSDQYRVQAHLYGRGFARAGFTVNEVAVAFLPRDAELTAGFVLREPYDEAVAVRALTRAEGYLQRLVYAGGNPAVASEGDGPCGSSWCRWCPRAVAPVSMFA